MSGRLFLENRHSNDCSGLWAAACGLDTCSGTHWQWLWSSRQLPSGSPYSIGPRPSTSGCSDQGSAPAAMWLLHSLTGEPGEGGNTRKGVRRQGVWYSIPSQNPISLCSANSQSTHNKVGVGSQGYVFFFSCKPFWVSLFQQREPGGSGLMWTVLCVFREINGALLNDSYKVLLVFAITVSGEDKPFILWSRCVYCVTARAWGKGAGGGQQREQLTQKRSNQWYKTQQGVCSAL